MDKYLNYNIQIYIYGQTKRTLHPANYCNLPSDLISLLHYYKSFTHTHTHRIFRINTKITTKISSLCDVS